jgi:rhamnose utilization protein RhaD (predicted bifunctional aldolase and dehydrogenase)
MNPLSLFYFQIGIDALMCGLILYFLWRVGKKTAEPVVGGEQARQELQRLIAESQKSAEQFLDALAEGRKALKEIAYALDERESRLQTLCLRAEALTADAEPEAKDADDASPASDNQEQVRRMASDGASVPDIVMQTGLTEGEVRLIIDLARSRNENR